MADFSNHELIRSIQNGDEKILFYLAKKYYQSARRLLRRSGCRDSDTPAFFSKALVKIFREIQLNKISPNVEFEQFFFNSIHDYFNQEKLFNNLNENYPSGEIEIISACFALLDESTRKIISLRYVEKLSFEEIAVRLNFSNPVIAQFEFNRAFSQYEKIASVRMNLIPD